MSLNSIIVFFFSKKVSRHSPDLYECFLCLMTTGGTNTFPLVSEIAKKLGSLFRERKYFSSIYVSHVESYLEYCSHIFSFLPFVIVTGLRQIRSSTNLHSFIVNLDKQRTSLFALSFVSRTSRINYNNYFISLSVPRTTTFVPQIQEAVHSPQRPPITTTPPTRTLQAWEDL